jgi:CRISPR/Cas system-associated protein endoribonuclease Cas2
MERKPSLRVRRGKFTSQLYLHSSYPTVQFQQVPVYSSVSNGNNYTQYSQDEKIKERPERRKVPQSIPINEKQLQRCKIILLPTCQDTMAQVPHSRGSRTCCLPTGLILK